MVLCNLPDKGMRIMDDSYLTGDGGLESDNGRQKAAVKGRPIGNFKLISDYYTGECVSDVNRTFTPETNSLEKRSAARLFW